jgi:hypothetical protein
MVGGLFYTLKWSRFFFNAKKIKVQYFNAKSKYSIQYLSSYGTAKGNSKDDLSEIRFVFGIQVSPLWWYYRQEVLQKPNILRLLELAK